MRKFIKLATSPILILLLFACGKPSAPTRPPQPDVKVQEGTLLISWTPVGGAGSYEVYVNAGAPPDLSAAAPLGTSGTSLRIEETDKGTTYYVVLVAVRSGKRSEPSAIASVTTVPDVPSAPKVEARSRTSYRVKWDAVAGAIDYRLHYDLSSRKDIPEEDREYRGTGAIEGDSPILAGDCLSYPQECSTNLSGLMANSTYYFALSASNRSGESGLSEEAEYKAGPGPYPPPSVKNPVMKITGLGEIELSWEAEESTDSYRIYYDTDAAGAPYDCSPDVLLKSKCPVTTSKETKVTITGLKPDIPSSQTYHVAVVPVNVNGVPGCQPGEPGCLAAEATCSPETVGCRTDPPVEGLTASPTASTSAHITLGWTALQGATGYDVLVGTSKGSTSTATIAVGNVKTYAYTAPAGGTEYFVSVRGTNALGVGRAATDVKVTTIPSPPSGISATASFTSSRVALKWSAATGATSYKIHYDTDATSPPYGGSGAKEGSSPITVTDSQAMANCSAPNSTDRCATLTTLTNGTTYSLALQSVSAAGEGTLSSAVSFVPLAAPTDFKAEGEDSLSFSWTAVSGAKGYKIYSDTETGGGADGRYGTTVATVTSGTTTSTSATISSDSTLYFAMTALWPDTTSPSSESAYSSQQALANAPPGFAVRTCTGKATLTWAPLAGTTDYALYYATSSCASSSSKAGCYNGSATPVSGASYSTATATACAGAATATPGTCSSAQCAATISGLANGTTHYFSIRAVFDSRKTPFATELSSKTLAAPTGLSVSSCTTTSASLSWTAVTGADSYKVCYQTASAPSAGSCPGETAASTVSATISSLTAGSTYFFVVDAISGTTAVSDHSSSVSVAPLSAPTNPDVTAPATAAAQSTAHWTSVSGATSYTIYYGTSTPVTTTSITGETDQAAEDLNNVAGEPGGVSTALGKISIPEAGGTGGCAAIAPADRCATLTGLTATKDYYWAVAAVTTTPSCESSVSAEVRAPAGWPKVLGATVFATPALGNLDGDANIEIVVADSGGQVSMYDHDGTRIWTVTPGAGVYRPLVISNYNAAGTPEIFFTTTDGNFRGYTAGGLVESNFPILFTDTAAGTACHSDDGGTALKLTAPAIGNLDTDANLEFVVGASNGRLYALDDTPTGGTSGACLNQLNANWGDADLDFSAPADGVGSAVLPAFGLCAAAGAIYADPAIGDIDGDGINEIVIGADNGALYAYEAATGAAVAGWPICVSAGKPIYSGVTLVDLDGDRDLEIVVALSDGTVRAYHGGGTAVTGWTALGASSLCTTTIAPPPAGNDFPLCPAPVAGDINRDGSPEVIIATNSGTISVFTSAGAALSGWPVSISGAAFRSTPALVNVDSDLDLEIVLGSALGVYALNPNGTSATGFPITLSSSTSAVSSVTLEGTVLAGPVAGDIDGTGGLDLIVADQGKRLNILRTSGAAFANARFWPMHSRNENRTGFWGPSLPLGWRPGGVDLGAAIESSPNFADLDSDNLPEILAASNKLFAIEYYSATAQAPAEVTGWGDNAAPFAAASDGLSLDDDIIDNGADDGSTAATCDGTPTTIQSSPAAGDLNNPSAPDVAIGIGAPTTNACVYARRSDGATFDLNGVAGVAFKPGTSTAVQGGVAMANLDGDASLEMVFGASNGLLYVLNSDGSAVAGWPKQLNNPGIGCAGGAIRGTPAIGDIDGNGAADLEIAVAADDGCLYVLNSDGSSLSTFPVKLPTCGDGIVATRSSPALGNINTDTPLEIVVGSDGNCLFAYKFDATAVTGFPYTSGGNIQSSPALGNLDSDTALEIVFGSDDGKVYALNGDGTLLTGWPVSAGAAVTSSPVIVDLNGDGQLDILISANNRLQGYDRTGGPIPGFPILLTGAISFSSPQTGDLAGDGQLFMAVGSQGNALNLFTLGIGSNNSADNCKGWQGFHNNAARTGVNTSPSSCP